MDEEEIELTIGEEETEATLDSSDMIVQAVSPKATVTKSGNTATITITDIDGTTTTQVYDGTDGTDGTSISDISVDSNYCLVITLDDGSVIDTAVPLKGEQGEPGDTGNGISSIVVNPDYTLTITYTNGMSATTASVCPVKTVTTVLGTDAWEGSTSCTITVNGVTANNTVIISPAPQSMLDYINAGVYCWAQATNKLTFKADTAPTEDLTVNIFIC